mmetsp:Transcript_7910/g.18660  ORF Transcript_7910/g.18660 Transcript_7910/m.18660 type:complete len:233 (-) Transcript_7910:449-1147(-)
MFCASSSVSELYSSKKSSAEAGEPTGEVSPDDGQVEVEWCAASIFRSFLLSCFSPILSFAFLYMSPAPVTLRKCWSVTWNPAVSLDGMSVTLMFAAWTMSPGGTTFAASLALNAEPVPAQRSPRTSTKYVCMRLKGRFEAPSLFFPRVYRRSLNCDSKPGPSFTTYSWASLSKIRTCFSDASLSITSGRRKNPAFALCSLSSSSSGEPSSLLGSVFFRRFLFPFGFCDGELS